jgi:hypothetical protein
MQLREACVHTLRLAVEGVEEAGAFFHVEITKAVGKVVTVSMLVTHHKESALSICL